MCRIETSLHACGHAKMPIHEFCPRNPSRLLPNEDGACKNGYERSVPLLPDICHACRRMVEGNDGKSGGAECSGERERVNGLRLAKMKTWEVGELVERVDERAERVKDEQKWNFRVGEKSLSLGGRSGEIAWQQ